MLYERGFAFYKDSTPQAPVELQPEQDCEQLVTTFLEEFRIYDRSYPTRNAVIHALNHVERTSPIPLTSDQWKTIATILINRGAVSLLDFDNNPEAFHNHIEKHHRRWASQVRNA